MYIFSPGNKDYSDKLPIRRVNTVKCDNDYWFVRLGVDISQFNFVTEKQDFQDSDADLKPLRSHFSFTVINFTYM